jgi:hypothetical protein
MRRQLAGIGSTSTLFAREHLRTPLTIALLVALPPVFVVASASVLSTFARALGGNVAGHAATTMGAAWSAAFIAGALGFFQTASARDADRRFALAGMGALPTALARLLAGLSICIVVTAAALVALRVKQPIPHLGHTVVAILSFAVVYLAIGSAVGVLVRDELAGSLVVVFVFLLDVFSGPGMAPPARGLGRILTPSRYPGELLLRAGAGMSSPAGDWRQAMLSITVALSVALAVFWLAARSRA